ncbi:methanogenesis imperfect marker protein 11 [Methanoculleus chikugoensis]|uniref:Methanogenesis imperfect marker protein 11 n=1 Tax=Methanoculleus chikugoensis TaxID=118126 RepID=A0A1M4MMY2_9EURY|nr:methanogenesis marker protein 11 [Methanoculleus chikugoensis]SCL76269.1 methanogenesis imperfect marker protein 11 [Methanoculleus chikugoensis]
MERLSDPYTIRYPQIVAVADESGGQVELVEFFDCTGGAMWVKRHYAQSPLVRSVRTVGATNRYLLSAGSADLALEGSVFPAGIAAVIVEGDEIAVTYRGLGGGGVGASVCRAGARGVVRCVSDPAGGGRLAGSTVWLPRRERVIVGIDDTDTPEEGATWTLAHNIARAVEDDRSRYLSHTIVQLYPVPYRTKNCVAIACEFATSDPEGLIRNYRVLLEEYTLSDETGMAVWRGFDPSPLEEFGCRVKRGEVSAADLAALDDERLSVVMDGRGVIGAVAAIPFYTRYEEALALWNGFG